MIPPWAIATTATSQSTVLNNQVQLGDVFAGQTLNVVSQSDAVSSAVASGNAVSAAVAAGDLSFTSSQTMAGATGAEADLGVSQFTGSAGVTSAATGNEGDAQISSGGTLTAQTTQAVTGSSVSANASLAAPNAQVQSASFDDQAIANSQTFSTADSTVNAEVSQLNDASVTTTASAQVGYLPDSGAFLSSAIGNAAGSTGAGAATQSLGVAQTNQGPLVQAVNDTGFGDSQTTLTEASAAANNADFTNAGGSLAAAVNQSNTAAVLADGEETADQFGSASVQAQAVGNSTLAADIGSGVALDNVQVNGTGGVDAIAGFDGGAGGIGYDATASATAVGNSATGFDCSQCGGVMAINNSQSNGSAVSAQSNVGVASPARSVSASAVAVGNAASFYVTSPGG